MAAKRMNNTVCNKSALSLFLIYMKMDFKLIYFTIFAVNERLL